MSPDELYDITRLAQYGRCKRDCLIEVKCIGVGKDSTTVAELQGVWINNLSMEGYAYNSFSDITEVKLEMFYDVCHLLED